MTRPTLIRDLLAQHFDPGPLDRLAVVRARFPHWLRPDVQRGIDSAVVDSTDTRFVGARLRGSNLMFRFSDLVEEGARGIATGPPVYDELDVGDAQTLRCLQHGLWLVCVNGVRLALLLDVLEGLRRASVRVEVAARESDRTAAEGLIARVRAVAERAATFRGKVLAPSEDEYAFDDGPTTLRIARVAPVAREDIVLAPGILDLVERNTIGFAARCDALLRLGMPAHKGVLLYGPPGTGKTFLVRYLAGALPEHTKFLLSGDRLAWLADTVEAARLLAPSMIVIEDVDLIAADRDGPYQRTPGAFNRLLNDMDGAGPDAQLLFVLTTNRVEVLEPALAARPGRVDQAIEIGLPGDAERRALLRRYARGMAVADDTIAHVSGRTGRVSPAFIKELVRRAAQGMLERGDLALEEADFDRALVDMTGANGRVTASLLGAERIGFLAQN